MNKSGLNLLFGLIVLALFGTAYYMYSKQYASDEVSPEQDTPVVINETEEAAPEASTPVEEEKPTEVSTAVVSKQVKTPNFVTSIPVHGAKLSAAPDAVTLTFSAALSDNSQILVMKDSQPVNAGLAQVLTDTKTLTVPLNTTAPGTGEYSVAYTACWTSGACDNGSFDFSVR